MVNLKKVIDRKLVEFKNSYEPKIVNIAEDIKINKYIEHTLLKPTATSEDIEKLCKEAIEYNFLGVCVNPVFVPFAKRLLEGSNVKLVTVVGFPLGATNTETKVFETKWVVDNGADEVDMVINIGKLKEKDYQFVYEDIKAVVESAKVPVKVIIETCYLTDEEKVIASVLTKLAGAQFVKTSTGFGTGGATFEDVALMKWSVDYEIGVKASGGVRTFEDAIKMIKAGADRIGTSSGIVIVKGK